MKNILRWIGLIPFSVLCSIAGYWAGIFAYANILNTVTSGFDWGSFNSYEITLSNIIAWIFSNIMSGLAFAFSSAWIAPKGRGKLAIGIMISLLVLFIIVSYIIPESRKIIDISYVISAFTILCTSIVVLFKYHCCPEKFYHKVGCSTEPASGTLTGVVG